MKTTNCGAQTPFFITRNELAVSEESSAEYRLYRVFDFAAQPKIFELHPLLREMVRLEAQSWRASFG